jgi:hypothetical protein
MVPDVVIQELILDTPSGKSLVAHGVTVMPLPGDLILEVYNLRAVYRRPSVPDLSALVPARSRGLVLLTGDSRLREAAENEGLVVHGTLWLVERMVAYSVVDGAGAADALERMLANGRRLPAGETRRRIESWRVR